MKPALLSLLSTIGVVLAVTGVIVLGFGLRRMGQASRRRKWPTTPGSIRSSTTVARAAPALPRHDEDAEDAAARPPQTLHRPEVTYTYTVQGKTYTGTALGLDTVEVSSERMAREHAARYVPGAPVTVYYDPENPSRALLEPGVQSASWLIPGAGAACLLVAAALYGFVRWFSGR